MGLTLNDVHPDNRKTVVMKVSLRFMVLPPNGGVDRATALPSSFAGSRLMRNSLPVAPVQRFVRPVNQFRQVPEVASHKTDKELPPV
jgi:hypothetical protein